MNLLLLGLGGPEIILIILVVLLLFGAKKIPELMHGMGKGVKSFKDGMNGVDGPAAENNELRDSTQQTEEKK